LGFNLHTSIEEHLHDQQQQQQQQPALPHCSRPPQSIPLSLTPIGSISELHSGILQVNSDTEQPPSHSSLATEQQQQIIEELADPRQLPHQQLESLLAPVTPPRVPPSISPPPQLIPPVAEKEEVPEAAEQAPAPAAEAEDTRNQKPSSSSLIVRQGSCNVRSPFLVQIGKGSEGMWRKWALSSSPQLADSSTAVTGRKEEAAAASPPPPLPPSPPAAAVPVIAAESIAEGVEEARGRKDWTAFHQQHFVPQEDAQSSRKPPASEFWRLVKGKSCSASILVPIRRLKIGHKRSNYGRKGRGTFIKEEREAPEMLKCSATVP